jgi:hypothetical protein
MADALEVWPGIMTSMTRTSKKITLPGNECAFIIREPPRILSFELRVWPAMPGSQVTGT